MPCFSYDNRRIYYEEHGKGHPVIFCHGNTSSSRMFSLLMPLYEKDLHCILIDFLGCGRSDRTASFPSDIWIDEARQVVCLVQHLELDEVSLIGTSGGAWVVMNAAMMMKGRVSSIIADSFDGRTLNSSFSSNLTKERESAMKDEDARGFYEWCLGPDWQDIVLKDTKALIECADRGDSLFVSPPSALDCPVLLTGSVEDLMCRSDMKEEYGEMKKMMGKASIHMFPHGGHPSILSNAEEFAVIARDFIMENVRLN